MSEFTDKQFDELKVVSEEKYKTFGEVLCPYFQEKIIFNSKGLEHLKFKNKNHARSRNDQYMRLKLIHLAPELLKITKTIQGISEKKIFENIRSNNRTDRKLITAKYYEFVAIIQNKRIRIVVKQIESGQKYFWSIIPHWKVNKDGIRKMNNGNPEED